MAEDINTLVLQVKSDGIKEGTNQLNDLTKAAQGAEQAASKLGTGVASSDSAVAKASGTQQAFAEATEKTTKATSKLTLEQRKQVYEYEQAGKAYKAAAEEAYKINAAIDKNTTANATATKAVDNYQKKLDAQTRSMGLLMMEAERMNKAFDAQAASFAKSFDEANRLNAAIDAATGKQRQLAMATAQGTEATKNNTHGHGSNAAAIREVMVLTHELSQGQYKRFGGSMLVLANQMDLMNKAIEGVKESTAGAITSWVLGATAVTALVAAIGLLLVGIAAGTMQQKAFADAILQTGNYAGMTVDNMNAMAASVAKVGGTIGSAKEAIALMGETGKFTKDQMEGIAKAAVLSEEAFGKSVDETVKEFAKLAELSVTFTSRSNEVITKHVVGMNNQYHALSAAQVEVIANLEKEGHAADAAAMATKLFSEALADRAKQSIENLGYIAKAWHGVKAAISAAISGIGEWGAKSTLAKELAELETRKRAQEKLQTSEEARQRSNLLYDKLIADKRLEIQKATDKAAEEGRQQQLEQQRQNGLLRFNEVAAMNNKEFKKKRELEELDTVYSIQSDDFKLKNLKLYQEARAKIIADGTPKAARGDDDRVQQREMALDAEKGAMTQLTMAYQQFIKTSKNLADKQHEDQRTSLEERKLATNQYLLDLTESFEKELAIINKYHPKNKNDATANDRKRQNLTQSYANTFVSVRDAQDNDSESVTNKEVKAQDTLIKKIEEEGKARSKVLQAALDADNVKAESINQVKSVAINANRELQVAEYKRVSDQIDKDQEILDGTKAATKFEQDAAAKRMEYSRQQLDLLDQIIQAKAVQFEKEKAYEDAMSQVKDFEKGLAAAKRFEKGMTDVFGTVGTAIGKIAVSWNQVGKAQAQAHADYMKSAKTEQDAKKRDKEVQDAQIAGYADMAAGAAGFFDKGSKGYNTMMGISKAFHAVQIAQNVIEMGQLAIKAVLNQASGDPYTAFARMAAMAAAVAALGYAVGGGFNSNGGGESAADVQKKAGTGTVFGDAEAKSESISKSIESLEDNSSVMLPLTSAMLKSLKAIEASMTGLANIVLRTTGLTDASNMNITTGKVSSGETGLLGTTVGITNSLASAIPVIGGLVSGVIGKVSSLWGSVKQSVIDNGIMFGGSVSDLQAGKGYNQYASIDTTKKSFFGLKKSTSNRIETTGLGEELSSQFGLIFTNLETTLKTAATALGKNGDDVGKTIDNLVIETSKISLKDLKGEELEKQINAVISATMDQIAEAAFPSMGAFRKVGEGYAETVIRVASGIETAQSALKQLGVTAIAYTDIVNKQGDVGAEMVRQSIVLKEGTNGVAEIINNITGEVDDLVSTYKSLVEIRNQMNGTGLNGAGLNLNQITGAGGVSELSKALSTYSQKFFTDSERITAQTKELTASFAALGQPLPTTNENFRAMVEAADKLGTAAGDELVGKLLTLAEGFDDLTSKLNEIAQQRQDLMVTIATYDKDDATLRAITVANRQKELAAMDASVRPLQERVYAIEDETAAVTKANAAASAAFAVLSKAVNAQKDALNDKYDAEVDAINATKEAAKEAATAQKELAQKQLESIKKVYDAITSAIASTTVESDALNAARRKQAQATLEAAQAYATKGGKLENFAGLEDALKDVSKPSEAFYATFEDYASDQAKTAYTLTALQASAKGQVDYAQLTVDRLDDTIKAIDKSTTAQLEALKKAHDEEIKKLDEQLATAQAQLDALNGTTVAIKSLEDAIKGFAAAVTSAINTQKPTVPTATDNATKAGQDATKAGGNAYDAAVTSLYNDMLGRDPEAAGLEFWADKLAAGQSISQISEGIANSEEYKDLHKFDVGTNYVPQDMPAFVHKGERIIPAADNAALMNKLAAAENGSGNMSNADIADLRAAIAELRDAVQAGDIANVQISKETYKILRKWDNDGQPPTRTE